MRSLNEVAEDIPGPFPTVSLDARGKMVSFPCMCAKISSSVSLSTYSHCHLFGKGHFDLHNY